MVWPASIATPKQSSFPERHAPNIVVVACGPFFQPISPSCYSRLAGRQHGVVFARSRSGQFIAGSLGWPALFSETLAIAPSTLGSARRPTAKRGTPFSPSAYYRLSIWFWAPRYSRWPPPHKLAERHDSMTPPFSFERSKRPQGSGSIHNALLKTGASRHREVRSRPKAYAPAVKHEAEVIFGGCVFRKIQNLELVSTNGIGQ